MAAESYGRMGDRFENQQAADYSKIVKDYPLSPRADDAKAKLQAMNRPVPEADPAAVAHMQYELENQDKGGKIGRTIGVFKQRPDTRMAAKSGTPSMDPRRPTIPVSVPQSAAVGVTDVNAAVVTDTTAIDKNPDARANPTGQTTATGTGAAASTDSTAAAQQQLPPPTNHPAVKKKKGKKNQPDTAPPTTPAAATTPATSTAPADPAAPATPQK
jgi:outer membrane protein assembly factor BamD